MKHLVAYSMPTYIDTQLLEVEAVNETEAMLMSRKHLHEFGRYEGWRILGIAQEGKETREALLNQVSYWKDLWR